MKEIGSERESCCERVCVCGREREDEDEKVKSQAASRPGM